MVCVEKVQDPLYNGNWKKTSSISESDSRKEQNGKLINAFDIRIASKANVEEEHSDLSSCTESFWECSDRRFAIHDIKLWKKKEERKNSKSFQVHPHRILWWAQHLAFFCNKSICIDYTGCMVCQWNQRKPILLVYQMPKGILPEVRKGIIQTIPIYRMRYVAFY